MENSQVKSVFKSSDGTISKEAFTELWIKLINSSARNNMRMCSEPILPHEKGIKA